MNIEYDFVSYSKTLIFEVGSLHVHLNIGTLEKDTILCAPLSYSHLFDSMKAKLFQFVIHLRNMFMETLFKILSLLKFFKNVVEVLF